MHKILRRLLIIITTILVIAALSVLFFFTTIPSYTGVILEVSDSTIWVVEGTADDIKNKTTNEINKKYMYQGIVFELPAYIPNQIIKDLSIGQEVKIYSSGEVRETAPAGGDAYWVTTLDKE
ncbi:DUF3221 domain-containing protein [Niallia circulans]|uniref:DUF3221 domain-containing protein n=1 Tax=Niallia circulans TaxID=1397 RepID=UPI00163B2FC5|nr:DUF3221 domain-containing protein [Niallia circulans]